MDKKRQEYRPGPYLSDFELDALIRQVEEREMLRAPSYLKGEILLRIERNEICGENGQAAVTARKAQAAAVRENGIFRLERQKRQLFLYGLKVSLAAAAAIIMLFVMPAGGRPGGMETAWALPGREEPHVNQVVKSLGEHSTRLCRKLNSASTWLVCREKDEPVYLIE